MIKRIAVYGLGSHAALAAVLFMLLAGSLDLPALIRAASMTALTGWAMLLLVMLVYARMAWERINGVRRVGLITLAVPGWALALPIALLIMR